MKIAPNTLILNATIDSVIATRDLMCLSYRYNIAFCIANIYFYYLSTYEQKIIKS